MRRLLLALLLLAGMRSPAFPADRVIVSYSSRSYAFLPAQVAAARGFFRDENVDPVLVQMRSQVTVPALMSGEVHYTLSFGNIIGSAMQGMPFKIVAVLTDKPLHSIIARPDIKTIDDLRGKRIGSQRIGGSDHLAAEAVHERLAAISDHYGARRTAADAAEEGAVPYLPLPPERLYLDEKEWARRLAAGLLEASPDDVRLENGQFRIAGAPDRAVDWAQVAAVAYGRGTLPPGETRGLESTAFFETPYGERGWNGVSSLCGTARTMPYISLELA